MIQPSPSGCLACSSLVIPNLSTIFIAKVPIPKSVQWMRWGHKYGARYGGVGTVVEGDIQDIWKGDNGWTTVRLTGNFDCTEILVKPRIAKIPD